MDPVASKELIRQLRKESGPFGGGGVRVGWLLTRLLLSIPFIIIGFVVLVGGLAAADGQASGFIAIVLGLAAGAGLMWLVRRLRPAGA